MARNGRSIGGKQSKGRSITGDTASAKTSAAPLPLMSTKPRPPSKALPTRVGKQYNLSEDNPAFPLELYLVLQDFDMEESVSKRYIHWLRGGRGFAIPNAKTFLCKFLLRQTTLTKVALFERALYMFGFEKIREHGSNGDGGDSGDPPSPWPKVRRYRHPFFLNNQPQKLKHIVHKSVMMKIKRTGMDGITSPSPLSSPESSKASPGPLGRRRSVAKEDSQAGISAVMRKTVDGTMKASHGDAEMTDVEDEVCPPERPANTENFVVTPMSVVVTDDTFVVEVSCKATPKDAVAFDDIVQTVGAGENEVVTQDHVLTGQAPPAAVAERTTMPAIDASTTATPEAVLLWLTALQCNPPINLNDGRFLDALQDPSLLGILDGIIEARRKLLKHNATLVSPVVGVDDPTRSKSNSISNQTTDRGAIKGLFGNDTSTIDATSATSTNGTTGDWQVDVNVRFNDNSITLGIIATALGVTATQLKSLIRAYKETFGVARANVFQEICLWHTGNAVTTNQQQELDAITQVVPFQQRRDHGPDCGTGWTGRYDLVYYFFELETTLTLIRAREGPGWLSGPAGSHTKSNLDDVGEKGGDETGGDTTTLPGDDALVTSRRRRRAQAVTSTSAFQSEWRAMLAQQQRLLEAWQSKPAGI